MKLNTQPGIEIENENLRTFVFEAVRELLFNVAKHAGKDPSSVRAMVDMSLDERQWYIVRVTDNGQGCLMDEHRLANQAGFGLFGIQQRIQHLGGEFSAWSQPGEGMRIMLAIPPLPAVAPPAHAPYEQLEGRAVESAIETRPRVVVRRAKGNGHTIRVLLVDDHAIVRQGLARVLEAEADISVIGEARDGMEAVASARDLRPDVVIMDISMPRMDGIEATRRITQEQPGLRVIGLSMYEEAERSQAIRAAGAEALFCKDGSAEKLIGAIRGGPARASRAKTLPSETSTADTSPTEEAV